MTKKTELSEKLKVGDKVFVLDDNFGKEQYTKHTVKTVTLSGKIRLDDGSLFNKHGVRKLSDYKWLNLVEYTPELDENVKNNNRIKYLQNSINAIDMRTIENIDVLERIWNIITYEKTGTC